MPTAPAGPTPPPGYAESCAASEPWGVQVSTPFVCIDAPGPNTTVPPGGDLVVRGYAGGSFESHVLIEVGGVLAQSGSNMVAAVPLTYVAPDLGMPGFWSTTIHLPTGNLPSTLRVTASFSSPRDGSVVASASVDFSTR